MKTRIKILTVAKARRGFRYSGWTESEMAKEIMNSVRGFTGGMDTTEVQCKVTVTVEFQKPSNKEKQK